MQLKLLVGVGFLFSSVLVSSAWFSDHEMQRLFLQFIQDYHKSYQHDEYYYRYQNFKNNLDQIYALNSKPGQTARYDINKFSDLSPEEFSRLYLLPKFNSQDVCKFPYGYMANPEEVSALPTSFDWRGKGAVSPVKDQKACGSCWAFSAAENIEGQWQLGGNPLVNLSEQWIVDCSHGCLHSEPTLCNGGCGGGLPWLAYADIMKHGYLTTETAYPYTGYDGTCKNPAAVGAKISNWTAIKPDQDSIISFLVQHGPLSICLNANMLMSYAGGIISGTPNECPSIGTDHAVLLVGYDNTGEKPIWIVKNSWGTNWGEKGYFRIEADNDLCGIWDCVTSATL